MTALFFIAMVLLVYWTISRINRLFEPPTIEEQIERIKEQEGTVKIHKSNRQEAEHPKPKLQDLGTDIDFEEVKE